MPKQTSALHDEITQTRPFRSGAEEIVVSVLRTAAVVQRHLAQVVDAHGITIQQYNVLRILRGAGAAGMPTLAIRDRMVEEAAGVTRLLDKLERAGYVLRERSSPDRRQVLCRITDQGMSVVNGLDAPMDVANRRCSAMLDGGEHSQVVELLGAVRAGYTTADASNAAQRSTRAGQPPR